eukprot:Skav236098  [mRNA]  locus=scaffold1166:191279:192424:+ [translate_table: standard]
MRVDSRALEILGWRAQPGRRCLQIRWMSILFAFYLLTQVLLGPQVKNRPNSWKLASSLLELPAMSQERSRDYTRIEDAHVMRLGCKRDNVSLISNFYRLKCKQYPNGLVFDQGRLLVAHYYGQLEVYNSDFQVVQTLRLPTTGSPGQICMAGELCERIVMCCTGGL